jgi:hypothetical protein
MQTFEFGQFSILLPDPVLCYHLAQGAAAHPEQARRVGLIALSIVENRFDQGALDLTQDNLVQVIDLVPPKVAKVVPDGAPHALPQGFCAIRLKHGKCAGLLLSLSRLCSLDYHRSSPAAWSYGSDGSLLFPGNGYALPRPHVQVPLEGDVQAILLWDNVNRDRHRQTFPSLEFVVNLLMLLPCRQLATARSAQAP